MSGVDSMLRDIEAEVRCTRDLTGRSHLAPCVMDAMAAVPRERFVPDEVRTCAHYNGPLPIGCGQTISQPFIVALMTDLLAPRPDHVVLELGTGSGYQAAVLSRVVRRVYSMEIVDALAAPAAERLTALGCDNVEVRAGDAYFGWPEHAPYDGIMLTAAATHLPPPLLDQLAPGGHLVAPLGPAHGFQELVVLSKDSSGMTTTRRILGVSFVPVTGGHRTPPPGRPAL